MLQSPTDQLSGFMEVPRKTALYSLELTLSLMFRLIVSNSPTLWPVYITSVRSSFQNDHAMASLIIRVFPERGGSWRMSFLISPAMNFCK